MRKLIFLIACLLIISCGGLRQSSSVDRAYESGQLSQYQYLQLKIMERHANEAETANDLSIMNSGRWQPAPYQWREIK
jgi:hypothetical protein